MLLFSHHVWLFGSPWTTARQVSLSLTISQSLPKFKSIESVMPSNHLILCPPIFLYCSLLLPSIFPSIWVFSNESAVRISWPKYWSFSFSISIFQPKHKWESYNLPGQSHSIRETRAHTFSGPQIQVLHNCPRISATFILSSFLICIP